MAEWLSEEREVELIDMWQARPLLYKVISKEHSIIEIKECWSCSRIICGFAYDLPFCIFPFAAGVADAATRIFQFILF